MVWIRLYEDRSGLDFSVFGILPRTREGLKGILFSPLIHGSWTHLFNNSLPFFISTTAIFIFYPKASRNAFMGIYFLTGLLVWSFGRQSYHVGASGLNYGFLTFLFFMGIFRKDNRSLALSFLVLFLYSGLIAGLFPGDPRISWESHIAGAITGFVFAIFLRKQDLKPKDPFEDEDSFDEHRWYDSDGELISPGKE
jgi:membrane associated rhomboid family serine protease